MNLDLRSRSRGVFIVGTGTDVGKTYVSALILKRLRAEGINANYYKAAASGNPIIDGRLQPTDALFVKRFAQLDQDPAEMVSYVYEEAFSPHLCARRENLFLSLRKVKEDYQKISDKSDFVLVEGSGGILCPIVYEKNSKIWLEDIIKTLSLPVVIVSDAGLGTINSTGLTVSYMIEKNIKISGIVLNNFDENNFMHVDNKQMIEEVTNLPIIAYVKKSSDNLEDFKLDIILENRL